MAAMSTVLTEFSNNGNSRTSTTAGHTAVKPKLVIEKKKVPDGGVNSVAEFSVKVVHATTDPESTIITQKVSFEAVVRYPVQGSGDDIAAALVIFRDIIAGDEFGSSVTTQNWL